MMDILKSELSGIFLPVNPPPLHKPSIYNIYILLQVVAARSDGLGWGGRDVLLPLTTITGLPPPEATFSMF